MNEGFQLNKECKVSNEQKESQMNKLSGVSSEQEVSAGQGSQMKKGPQLNDSS